ncbi:MAG: four helix bundle protein [Bacteroidales bacterium]|nr:four helix bundle protein [Bacteroidales bacterium]
MSYRGFEDLEVWRRSKDLTIRLYKELKATHDFAMKDQMIRASISIASNIAEGYERRSDKEFIRFLQYSKGSAAELKTQLLIAAQSQTITKKSATHLAQETTEIASMLEGLVKAIRKRITK